MHNFQIYLEHLWADFHSCSDDDGRDELILDHDDGQFFRAMEWLMFFFRPPLTSMVFQWF